jgi:hypothetical protein
MFIHSEISRELIHGRQREMLAYAQHRRLKNMLTAARTEGPRITGPGAHQVSLRLLRADDRRVHGVRRSRSLGEA